MVQHLLRLWACGWWVIIFYTANFKDTSREMSKKKAYTWNQTWSYTLSMSSRQIAKCIASKIPSGNSKAQIESDFSLGSLTPVKWNPPNSTYMQRLPARWHDKWVTESIWIPLSWGHCEWSQGAGENCRHLEAQMHMRTNVSWVK